MPLDKASKEALAKLAKATRVLNEQADLAVAYIAEVEAELEAIQPGFEARVLVEVLSRVDHPDRADCDLVEELYLGYGKVGRAWGLFAEKSLTAEPHRNPSEEWVEKVERELLRNCDRTTKILAVPEIPALLAILEEDITRAAGKVTEVLNKK